MALLTLRNAQLAFGHHALLDHADFALEAGERVGLIGRNGAGKSSLLKAIAGIIHTDDGEMSMRQGLRIAYVAQEPMLNAEATIFGAVSDGVADLRDLRHRYETLAMQGSHELDEIQGELDARGGWTWEQRVESVLSHLTLDGSRRIGDLSGGMKKRVALAQALAAQPDVMLLDEPTNHLDLDAITWLEGIITAHTGAVVFITHDRVFLDNVTTRIVELDRGKLLSYPGNYSAYERDKGAQAAFEAVTNAKADKLLAQEEVWIRKGVEARRTRSESRIVRLEALRSARIARREAAGQVRLDVDAGARSGKLVAELSNVSKRFGDTIIARDLTATVLRGDKLGLIGGNGVGKTTLLKMILGELAPDSGSVRTGTQLTVAYFDQLRDKLDLNATLAEFISPGSEWIEQGDKRKHVMSYLDDFLFPTARAQSPVSTLSGGERNRLLLARLFARPANVLVLDEPTNDLDIETLELLEQLLADYSGTVFIVSHDRRFLDNVVTSTIVAEGDGEWREYAGGVTDWLAQRAVMARLAAQADDAVVAPFSAKSTNATPPPSSGKAKLSFKEKRELDLLPAEIEKLEAEQASLNATLAAGEIYRADPKSAATMNARVGEIDALLLAKLERWETLAAR